VADDEKQPIIIVKKVKKVAGGHHGGAWKVAYADFVTAMMAFFLLLWLLNVTTDEQKAMISSYFSPTDPRISESFSGSGGVMGGTTMAEEGALTSEFDPVVATPAVPSGDVEGKTNPDAVNLENAEDEQLAEEVAAREEKRFKAAEETLRQAIESVPELQNLAANLLIDMTPEGLRIQIVDQEGKEMFPLSSSEPLPPAEKLLKLVAGVVQDMPNMISIRGHTDARPFGPNASFSNWELSADRANASRRVMLDGGLEPIRIENVVGKAARDPLIIEDPLSARNRRISIILLKESLVPGVRKEDRKKAAPSPNVKPKPDIRKREEGIIYFP
jgi:chemotaxis protein MotB